MPGSIRVFVEHPIAEGAAIPATAEQAHHLGTVLRRSPGDKVLLFNGIDGEFEATIEALRRDRGAFRAENRTRPQRTEPELILVFALLKRDATDLVVEKATELGVTDIRPVVTERTNATRPNLERLRAIARAAAEQCERLAVPRIAEPTRLPDLLAGWTGPRLAAALERSAAARPARATGPAALLVGPEGGFSPAERTLLARFPFVEPIGLGPHVLRAETACIAGLALLAPDTT